MIASTRARVIAGGVGVVAAAGLFVGLAVGRGADASSSNTTSTTAPPSTTTTADPTTTTAPPPVAPLTGLTGEFGGRLDRPALVVKIDNVPRAHPHAGINQADLVVEERVEGNLTRFAAVFHSQDAPVVGPVRSTRTTDLDILSLFGRPVFASSGANQGVLSIIHQAGVLDVGHNMGGTGFWRQGGRPAPHNLMTSTADLYQKAGADLPPAPRPLFRFRTEGDPLPAGAVPANGVAVSFGGGEIARFTWDQSSGTWLRFVRGGPHVDTDGRPLAPRNVVVMEIDYDLSGQQGRSRPHGITVGAGRARVYTEGHVVTGSWRRPTPADPLELVAADGSPITLTPGQTFLELPVVGGVIEL